jgi:hypothetical protein
VGSRPPSTGTILRVTGVRDADGRGADDGVAFRGLEVLAQGPHARVPLPREDMSAMIPGLRRVARLSKRRWWRAGRCRASVMVVARLQHR